MGAKNIEVIITKLPISLCRGVGPVGGSKKPQAPLFVHLKAVQDKNSSA